MELRAERVLAWRMRRQLLRRAAGTTTVGVVERLCGVHAQVSGSAEQAEAGWIAALTGTSLTVAPCTTGS